MQSILAASRNVRSSLRAINRFLTAIMEGRTGRGREDFSEFLVTRVRDSGLVPDDREGLIGLYISLVYGDPEKSRAVPYDLACRNQLFEEERLSADLIASGKKEAARRDLENSYPQKEWQEYCERRALTRSHEQWCLAGRQGIERRLIRNLTSEKIIIRKKDSWPAYTVYGDFARLQCYPVLRKLLAPFHRARFAEPLWIELIPSQRDAARSAARLSSQILDALYPSWYWHGGTGDSEYFGYLRKDVLNALRRFLNKYGEGAFVVLALLDVSRFGSWTSWRQGEQLDYYEKSSTVKFYSDFDKEELNVRNAARYLYDDHAGLAKIEYTSTCMSDFPGIAGTEPIAYLNLIKKINEFLLSTRDDVSLIRYYYTGWKSRRAQSLREFKETLVQLDEGSFAFREFSLDIRQKREDVRELEKLVEERWVWFASERPEAAGTWRKCDDLARLYLVSRACDLVRYGEEIAATTFPQPADPDHRRLVSSLVRLLEETQEREAQRREKEEDARERERIERDCAAKLAEISYPPPAVVADRVLSGQERGEVLRACEREFAGNEAVEAMIGVVKQFAEFCLLLGKPENHIKVRSGQFVEKEVYTRSVADMTNEMVQDMVRLPPFTAYAKLIDGEDGEQRVTVRKIRTLKPPEALDRESVEARLRTIATNSAAYHKRRDEIEEEIRLRQERWRRPAAESQAPVEREGERRSARPGGTDAGEADEPPPQFS